MGAALAVIFLLLFCNGLLAASEIAVVSSRRERLRAMARRGSRRAKAAIKLIDDPTRFLSTVQVGITIVGIFIGAFGERSLAEPLAATLIRMWPATEPFAQAAAMLFVVVVLTYLSLIIGELVPKRIAMLFPEQVALLTVRPMRHLAALASPVVRILTVSTNIVIRLLGVPQTAKPVVTHEEVRGLLEQGRQAGVFDSIEHDMVKNVLRLDDRRVSALMTPRTDIVWLALEDSPEEVKAKVTSCNHTRFPVAQGGLDNIVGIVRARDLLTQVYAGKPLDLASIMQQPLFVPESMTALELLEAFKDYPTHVAVVFDEYGGTQGLVTLNNVLESIVGEIPKPGEEQDSEVVQRADGSWLLGGSLPIDELLEIIQMDSLPEADRGEYTTLGGFVMARLGKIPAPAEHFDYGRHRFEVMDMDGNRVDKVLVSRIDDEPTETTEAG
ncbi:MAG: hemolysin family protein [Candidatus Sumerlaeaceae bacterium]|nr:hemolysin family protein [Candidatus Sumerlaeaceae bacterium]